MKWCLRSCCNNSYSGMRCRAIEKRKDEDSIESVWVLKKVSVGYHGYKVDYNGSLMDGFKTFTCCPLLLDFFDHA
jgi:hypothetical protein